MLRTYFPFRFFKAGYRDHTIFEREMITDINSALCEIIVQGKLKNKNIIVAQKVQCILLKKYNLVLVNLNVANLYMSTNSALEWSFPQRPFEMSCHVIVLASTEPKCELIQAFLLAL